MHSRCSTTAKTGTAAAAAAAAAGGSTAHRVHALVAMPAADTWGASGACNMLQRNSQQSTLLPPALQPVPPQQQQQQQEEEGDASVNHGSNTLVQYPAISWASKLLCAWLKCGLLSASVWHSQARPHSAAWVVMQLL